MSAKQLIIVSGVSGSGKSTALKALEDLGFFCVDNLPVSLVPSFVQHMLAVPAVKDEKKARSDRKSGGKGSASTLPVGPDRFALRIDCKNEKAYSALQQAIQELRDAGVPVTLFFFDCRDDVVLWRFKETRRPHPVLLTVKDRTIETVKQALTYERNALANIRQLADKVIDTSLFSPHELRRIVEEHVGIKAPQLEVVVCSFGFKYGVPHEVDLLVDVRFLPNPHFVPHLRGGTGEDKEVRDFVFAHDEANQFLERYANLLEFLLPKYQHEGKRYLTIGIGCTGGKHRSVAIAIALAERISAFGFKPTISHRDKSRQDTGII